LIQPDKKHALGNSGVLLQFRRKRDPALIVEFEQPAFAEDFLCLHIVVSAVKRFGRGLSFLVMGKNRTAESLKGRLTFQRQAIESLQILFREDLAKGGGYADAALGVQLVDRGGNEWL
jgi:hypothetical protein